MAVDGESLQELLSDWHAGELTKWHAEDKGLDEFRDDTGRIADKYAQNTEVVGRAERLLGKKAILDSFHDTFKTFTEIQSIPDTAPEL